MTTRELCFAITEADTWEEADALLEADRQAVLDEAAERAVLALRHQLATLSRLPVMTPNELDGIEEVLRAAIKGDAK
jgi:hypothetical protein